MPDHADCTASTGQHELSILITTITELLVNNAFVPAGGPFIVLLPTGGPFIFLPLVDNASVTAGGPFIFFSALFDVTADVSFQVLSQLCRSASELTF